MKNVGKVLLNARLNIYAEYVVKKKTQRKTTFYVISSQFFLNSLVAWKNSLCLDMVLLCL